MDWLVRVLGIIFRLGGEQLSPADIIPSGGIKHLPSENKIEISLENLSIPFTKPPKVWIIYVVGTGSMDPVMDAGHHNILIAGADAKNQEILVESLMVGDIVVYQLHPTYYSVIHRIVKIGEDSRGRKFTFRGDNNLASDPYPVRDEHIQWLSIGTIY